MTSPPTDDASALTEEDDGATVDLASGAEVSLRLAGRWTWEEPVVHGPAVTLTRVDYFQDPGFTEWVVTATGTGTAKVSVRGEPNCADTDACPPRTVSLRFEVTD